MRRLFSTALFLAAASFLYADEPKKADNPPAGAKQPPLQTEKKPEITLKVGDPAPKLTADKWLRGPEVASFAPGNSYVVEFWAIWCAPCIVMMPHMAEMQAEYRDKGVTFISYSARDEGLEPRNNLESVSALVKKRGDKLGYAFAYGDNRKTYDAWMTASGQGGIPCCFIVDKTGKIAYIGHPMYLDFVLPKVVAGQWNEADVKVLHGIEKEINDLFALASFKNADPQLFLKALAGLNAKYHWTTKIPYFILPKIVKLSLAKKNDEACQLAKDLLAKAVTQGDTATLGLMAYWLRPESINDNKDLAALAVQAAEARLKLAGEADFKALLDAMETYFAFGDVAKTGTYATKATSVAKAHEISALLESPAIKNNKALLTSP